MRGISVAHAGIGVLLLGWMARDRWMLSHDPAARWLWATLAFLGLGEIAHVPALYFAAENLFGPGWGMVIRHLTGVGASVSVLLMADHTFPSSDRLRLLHGTAGLASFAGCVLPWLVDPPATVPDALRDEPFYYDPTWRSGVHWAAFLVLLGWALAHNAVRCHRSAGGIPDPRVRTGVRLVGLGAASGLAYVTARGATVVAWLSGRGPGTVRYENNVDAVTLGPCLFVIILGLLWNRLLGARDLAVARRDVRVLKGHWRRLVAVLPEVSPWPGSTARAAADPDEVHWQRARLVVEIYDAVRALTSLVPEPLQDEVAARVAASGLTGRNAVAATEHICLELAIAAHAAGATAPQTHREPRLHAEDSAAAARTVARRLRALERSRVRRVVRTVLAGTAGPHLVTAPDGVATPRRTPMPTGTPHPDDAPRPDDAPDPGDRTLTQSLREAERTVRRLTFTEMDFEIRVGHHLGYLRTLASPRITGVLTRTGRLDADPHRRATDTALFVRELLFHGLDSPQGRTIIQRIDGMHRAWSIDDEDYRWVLTNFVVPGLHVAKTHGWRAFTPDECQALVDWWGEVGLRLGVGAMPPDAEGWIRLAGEYDRENIAPSDDGRRMLVATTAVAVEPLPRLLRPLAVRWGTVLFGPRVRDALGLPTPGRLTRAAVRAGLRLRALRRRRKGPSPAWFVPGGSHRDYPDGYTLDDLGRVPPAPPGA
ncbi:MAG: hypothetical protein QG622_356 [Actinomycetota bacterium]|nr:hypothetical protein [Actinomycetota bacterium]